MNIYSNFYIYGYPLKTKYKNLLTFNFFFFSHLAIETL
jgi:hypothetical protein